MQRTTFVAQPAHFSMSAMRRILSPSASPASNLTTSRVEPVQPNQPVSFASMSTSSSASATTATTATTHTPSSCPTSTSPPVFHQPRKPRGSLSSPPAHPVIPAHTPCLTYPADVVHAASDEEHADDDADDADDDDDDEYDDYDEFDDDLYDADPMHDDVAMWRRRAAGDARSDPVAIPNAHYLAGAHRALTHLPALPDPTPIVSSYLMRAASGEHDADAMSRRMCGACMQPSPFAPPVAFDDITPGKPDLHDVSARRMAYFDEDALY